MENLNSFTILLGLQDVLYLFVEIFEAFSTLPVPAMTTEPTTTQISTTDNQQCGRYTTVYHTSNVSSVKYTTTSMITLTQLPQSEYLRIQRLYLHLINNQLINYDMNGRKII